MRHASPCDREVTRAKTVQAEARAAHWLAEANRLQEAGMDDSKAYKKAEFWLARANVLRGY
jgi:hypothetical protein